MTVVSIKTIISLCLGKFLTTKPIVLINILIFYVNVLIF